MKDNCPAIEKIKELEVELDNISYIEVTENGSEEKKKLKINEVVKRMYEDMTILRDANRLHRIFKRWKLYWIAGIVFLLWFGFDIKTIVSQFIIKLFH